MTTTRTQLLTRLLDSPARLEAAERAHLTAVLALQQAKEDLANREAVLTLAGLPGKNAEEREARLRLQTLPERRDVEHAQAEEREALVALHRAQADASCWKAASRLVGGAGEGATDED